MSSGGLIIESYKLVLLPMWIAKYRYKNESFLVAVNAQSGKVAGHVPRSGWQIALAGLFDQNGQFISLTLHCRPAHHLFSRDQPP